MVPNTDKIPVIERDATVLEKIGLGALAVLGGLVWFFGGTKMGRTIAGGIIAGGGAAGGAKLIKDNWK